MKFGCEGQWYSLRRQFSSTVGECFPDGFLKKCSLECERTANGREIVEIFHPRVGDAQLDDRFEFLRDDGFFRIDEQPGMGASSNVG